MNLEFIKNKKNLLAFSGGIDSTFLFFLLLENNIDFDIAIVNYNQRIQSLEEINYAKEICKKYNKKCFIKEYKNNKNFSEKNARDFRYEFFDSIIENNEYNNLLTGHHLNDKMEWFLMQFTRGAGMNELIGLNYISKRKNYFIFRPLLDTPKYKLEQHLIDNNITYFIDDTNADFKYKRNYFRHNFSNQLVEEFEQGIIKSFKYIDKDIETINNLYSINNYEELSIIELKTFDNNIALKSIDQDLKKRDIVISLKTRNEILKQKEIIIKNTLIVYDEKNNKILISPYIKIKLDKNFKETCRINKIPEKIRGFLYKNKNLIHLFL